MTRKGLDAGPVFLLCGGGRTGSTLVQRLISSSQEVLMWGEHGGGVVPCLQQLIAGIQSWLSHQARHDRSRFEQLGCDAWIPNLNPDVSHFLAATRGFLDRALAEPARSYGFPRWGFKEIWYGREIVRFLQKVYPDASFVFLIRSPVACQRSVKSTHWYREQYGGRPENFLHLWARFSAELVDVQSELDRALVLRYEELLVDVEAVLNKLGAVTRIATDRFDRDVFGRVERGSLIPPVDLDDCDWKVLESEEVRGVAQKLGYDCRRT